MFWHAAVRSNLVIQPVRQGTEIMDISRRDIGIGECPYPLFGGLSKNPSTFRISRTVADLGSNSYGFLNRLLIIISLSPSQIRFNRSCRRQIKTADKRRHQCLYCLRDIPPISIFNHLFIKMAFLCFIERICPLFMIPASFLFWSGLS